MDHKTFAETDKAFRKACVVVGIKPTIRQASKYRLKRGLAYKLKHEPSTWLQRQAKANLKLCKVG